MSKSLTKLREAIAAERRSGGLSFNDESEGATDAALAAVEQEVAELVERKERVSEYVSAEWNKHNEPLFVEVRELRKDKDRLNWLEDVVNRDPLLLHDGTVDTRGFLGLGLRPGLLVRTLRRAIDDARLIGAVKTAR